MKIRHVLDAQNHYAQYMLKREPYGILLKLTDRCLVSRETEDGEQVDEIVGFVISKDGYQPADETTDPEIRFVGYLDRDEVENGVANTVYNTKQTLATVLTQLIQWGREWEQRTKPVVVPEQIEQLLDDTEPRSRKKRGR